MKLNGAIIVNAFGVPGQSLVQAKRLQTEFLSRGVQTEILSDAFLRAGVQNNQIVSDLKDKDFCVFLDKDKYLSQIIQDIGVRMFNSHKPIRTCDDKGETYLALAGKGINLPKTTFAPVCYTEKTPLRMDYVTKIENNLGYPMVVKTSYGSCGTGVYLIENRDQLQSVMQKLKTQPHLYQEYVDAKKGQDVRVIVIGGKTVAAMRRINDNDFRSNVALGGRGEKLDLTAKENQILFETAEKCAKILGLDYCGVDLLERKDGVPVVCEVNSNAFFEGIEKYTQTNVAGAYAAYVINTLTK